MKLERWKWVWIVALFVAVGNALVVVWRLPVQSRLANDADEQAAPDAAHWIAPLPYNVRLLLLASNQDKTHFRFSTRLIYFLYPHRIDIALNRLPPDAATHYDGILEFGRMAPPVEAWQKIWQKTGAGGWKLAGRDARASFIVAPRFADAVAAPVSSPRLPFPIRLLSGLFSMIVVIVLGGLLLQLTLRAPPFAAWWANLAVAHLVGATAFAIVQQVCILFVGKPLIWPVYVLLMFLLLASRFAIRDRKLSSDGVNSFAVWRTAKRPSDITLFTKNFVSEGHLAAGYTAKEFTPSRTVWGECLCYTSLLLGILTVLERMWLIGLDWDALAIWQLKAKMLFLDGNLAAWQNGAQFPYAHFDYPLLTPLLTWWTYRHFDAINLHWALANGFLFYADLLIIFAASARRYVPTGYALLATALLSGLPEVTLHAVSGYADLPLSVYFLGAGVFLIRALVEREAAAWPLAGWMLAGIILVKNEGLLACVSALGVIAFYFLSARRAAKPLAVNPANTMAQANGTESIVTKPLAETNKLTNRAAPNSLPALQTEKKALGWLLAPVVAYLPWLLLKWHWKLSNDVMQPAHPPHFTFRLLWWRMWYAIIYGFGKQLLWLGPWFPAWGLFGIVVLVGGIAACQDRNLLSWWKRKSHNPNTPLNFQLSTLNHRARPLWLLAGIQLCGYLGIYMITPSALPAHIISSVDRLVLHVAPTLLLAALVSCFAEEKHALQTSAQTE